MRWSFRIIPWMLLPALAWADGAADLRNSLQRLDGHAPMKASVTCSVREEHTTLLKPVVQERSQQFQVAEDDSGLHVDWSSPRETLKGPDAAALESLLNQAAALSNLLAGAQFKTEGREPYQGNQVRVLTFACQPSIPSQHQGLVSQAEASLKIWIGGDGEPLAAEYATDYTGRHSRLYGRIHSATLVRTTYKVLNQRLIAASLTSEDFTYDYGDKIRHKEILTLAEADGRPSSPFPSRP